MRRRPSEPTDHSITRQDELVPMCEKCRNEGRFAFDTEFVMEDRFEPEVCLIQLATREEVYIVDPFLDLDLAPVWGLVTDPSVETVVHAGQEDLGLCVQHTGEVPRRIYDVQIAAGFAGFEYPLSLQKLVQQTLHIRLHKAKTLTDWRRRPLTAEQIRYAAEDVCHLLVVRDRLHKNLAPTNRLDWVREEFERFEHLSVYRRAEEEKLLRVKGAGALKGRKLAVLRELIAWREERARRYNRPVRTVLKDYLLVEIAKHEMSTYSEVRDLRGINLGDRDIRSMCETVASASKTPPDQWPSLAPRDTETPEEAALISLLTAVIRSYALEQDMAYGLIASKRSIQEMMRHARRSAGRDQKTELLSGWRGQAVGTLLQDLLAGKRVVRVDSDRGKPRVHVSPPAG